MTREEILKSPEYWTAMIQLALYNCAERFMAQSGKNRTQLAEHLGVSKGYVTQLLSGEYDHRLSKMVELALAFGFVPQVSFVSTEKIIEKDAFELTKKWNISYDNAIIRQDTKVKTDAWESATRINKEAA